jgi:oligoendopeptidase F
MAATPENAYSMLADADLAFAPALDAAGAGHAVTNGGYIALQQSPDRTLRENAFKSFMGGWRQFGNTCAATLQGQVKQLAFFARARRYDSSLEAALAANEVPTSVYANLVEAVEGRLAPLHRYVDLRKRLLGVDELHYWDLYVPVVGDVEMTFTYEEACDIVLQALAPLGEDYLAIVRHGLASRWVDVYENPGKRSGAYSAGGYGMEPVVLMNFHGTLDDVFTLAHELGHSVHTYLSCRNQPPCCSDYPIFVAEVASTCNEALLIRWFLDNRANDPATRAYLINHFLEQFRGTMYRQTLFAAFEREAGAMNDRGEGLTCEALSALYADLCARYYGPGIAADPEITIEWARIPHFYYNYYVYQYATGFAAAVALSQRILEQGAPAVADYLGFLSGGSSKPPLDLLRGAGVDLQTPAPVEAALDLFASLVDELEGLLG